MRLTGWVDLDGAANVRDVGGLPLEGGGVTASGVLVRADNLQGLSPRDVDRLVEELGVRVVVDLRTEDEVRREGPGPLVGHVEIRHRSLYPDRERLADVMTGEPTAVATYLRYLRSRPDSVLGALADVAAGPGPVLVHCAAGKDRTGVVVALALSAAGVARDAVVADYVRTAERIGAIMRRLRASPTYAPGLDGVTDESRAPRAAVLTRVLEVLDEHEGGPVGWLSARGFDPGALRRRFASAP